MRVSKHAGLHCRPGVSMRRNAGLEDATYDLPPRRQKTAPKMRPIPSVKENLQGQWQPR